MLPLRFIKVAQRTRDNGQFDVAICATRIVSIMSIGSYQARRTVTEERKAGTLVNAAGKQAVQSVIFLDNGTVIASPMSVNRLLTAIERSNFKQAGTKFSRRLKVYDVEDEEPNPEIDEEMPDVTVEGGSFDCEEDLEEVFADEEESSDEDMFQEGGLA